MPKPGTDMGKKYIYEIAGCTACEECLYECKTGAIRMTENGAVIDQEKCVACGRCYESCPHGAIHRREAEASA